MDRRAVRRGGAVALALATIFATALSACEKDRAANAGARDGGADAAAASTTEAVVFRTADGWTIHGTWMQGTAPLTVVLAHQLGANRSEWEPLVAELRRGSAPPNVLTIDLRGHGESTLSSTGLTVRWPAFENVPTRWEAMQNDVAAAVAYVRSRRGDASVVLVGSSIGATAVVRHAASDPLVRGLVLLSPGLAYRGVEILSSAQTYLAAGHSALLIAGQIDAPSVEAITQIARGVGPNGATSQVTQQLLEGTGARGTALGAPGVHPELWASVARWIRELPAQAR